MAVHLLCDTTVTISSPVFKFMESKFVNNENNKLVKSGIAVHKLRTMHVTLMLLLISLEFKKSSFAGMYRYLDLPFPCNDL